MMFKIVLHTPPFISIRYLYNAVLNRITLCVLFRRPFGVENEYFVQLFLEMDESQKIPSI